MLSTYLHHFFVSWLINYILSRYKVSPPDIQKFGVKGSGWYWLTQECLGTLYSRVNWNKMSGVKCPPLAYSRVLGDTLFQSKMSGVKGPPLAYSRVLGDTLFWSKMSGG